MGIKLNLIVAVSENMGIGRNGDLPWRLKQEMAYFSKMTTTTMDSSRKNVVIMGRKTWESIPVKYKPLPNRINFVLSRSELDLSQYKDSYAFKNFNEIWKKLDEISHESVWVIGGASLYKDTIESPYFSRLYLTKIHKHFDCDTFFNIALDDFKEINDPNVPKEIQEENGVPYTYHVYTK